MAVVPMHKVQLVVHKDNVNDALHMLQKHGAMQFEETVLPDTDTPESEFRFAKLLPRVQHACVFLTPYEQKVGMLKALREGTQTELSESDVKKILTDTDALSAIVEDLEKLQVEFAEVNERVRTLEEQKTALAAWLKLPVRLADLETSTTVTKLLKVEQLSKKEATSLQDVLTPLLTEADLPFAITPASTTGVALTLPKEKANDAKLNVIFDEVKAEIVEKPVGIESSEVEYTAVSDKLAAAKSELALLHDQAEHFAITHLKTLQVANEVLAWEQASHVVLEQGAATRSTLVFKGWLREDRRVEVEREFAEKNMAAHLMELELEADEEPPVEIKNNKLIQPFELVTRLYGMPGYKDLDPTLFLAGFFFLFFGLSLTDVGYGLTLVGVSAFLLFFCKIPESMRIFAKLLLFVGTSTVLIGMLFGGYLGISADLLPEQLRAIQIFDPIGNPLPVFYMALSLGVLQVMVGIALKIYSEARNGRLLDGVLDQGPWLYMFFLGIIYVLTAVGYVDFLSNSQIVNLAYVGIVLIIVTSARHGKGPFDMIMKAAGSLYGSIGYLSDILSYSRLLALGLATTALAFAVNIIAGIVNDSMPIIGTIFAIIILIIGHVFTLAVNTLGAFIHSARLQFVEFFGKFIAGTGRDFSPLSRTEKYVTITDEKT